MYGVIISGYLVNSGVSWGIAKGVLARLWGFDTLERVRPRYTHPGLEGRFHLHNSTTRLPHYYYSLCGVPASSRIFLSSITLLTVLLLSLVHALLAGNRRRKLDHR